MSRLATLVEQPNAVLGGRAQDVVVALDEVTLPVNAADYAEFEGHRRSKRSPWGSFIFTPGHPSKKN